MGRGTEDSVGNPGDPGKGREGSFGEGDGGPEGRMEYTGQVASTIEGAENPEAGSPCVLKSHRAQGGSRVILGGEEGDT